MSDVQFWLSSSGGTRLQLPVNPPSVRYGIGYNYDEVDVANLGSIDVRGTQIPITVEIESFFPRDYNPSYCEYEFTDSPQDFVLQLALMEALEEDVRLTITGTFINIPVVIRTFEIEEQRPGEPGDVYYTLELKEKREPSPKKAKVEAQSSGKSTKVQAEKKRPESVKKQRTYTVKSGDSLWKIAARSDVYGDGSKWRKLYDANESVIGSNPDVIKSGQELRIP